MDEIIDQQLLLQAAPIFRELGMSVEQAINIFLAKAIKVRGLPFAVTLDERDIKISEPIPKISNAEITEAILTRVEGLLPEVEIHNLSSLEYCRATFGINFAVLKPISSVLAEDIRSAAKDEKGYNRYSTTRIAQRDGISYLICTQWTDRHRAAFVRWQRLYS